MDPKCPERFPLLQCLHLHKRYGAGKVVFRGAELRVYKGECVTVTAPSGSGKTTLVQLFFGLEPPDEGHISVAGSNPLHLSPRQRPLFRRRLGVIFQDLKLIMGKSVFENVALPLVLAGKERSLIEKKTRQALLAVQLEQKSSLQCSRLSRCEQQLVAIARATVNDPVILLADEPTASLDEKASRLALSLLHELNLRGTTILLTTKEPSLPWSLPDSRLLAIDQGRIGGYAAGLSQCRSH